MCLKQGCVEEPNFEAISKNENERADLPGVTQPPGDSLPSKNVEIIWPLSSLQQQGRFSAANMIKNEINISK